MNTRVGQFKGLTDVSRTFGMAMVRTITDGLSKLAVAPGLRLLRSAFSA